MGYGVRGRRGGLAGWWRRSATAERGELAETFPKLWCLAAGEAESRLCLRATGSGPVIVLQ